MVSTYCGGGNRKAARRLLFRVVSDADRGDCTSDQAEANSLSFFSGNTFTLVVAGFLGTSMNSPGLNGLGTCLRARRAGFFTVLIFNRPGRVNSPTPRFLTCRSMR